MNFQDGLYKAYYTIDSQTIDTFNNTIIFKQINKVEKPILTNKK